MLASAGDGAFAFVLGVDQTLTTTRRWKHPFLGSWRELFDVWRVGRGQGVREGELEGQVDAEVRSSSSAREGMELMSDCRTKSGQEIYDLAWSPDGTYILAGSVDQTASIYDVAAGAFSLASSNGRKLTFVQANSSTRSPSTPTTSKASLGTRTTTLSRRRAATGASLLRHWLEPC